MSPLYKIEICIDSIESAVAAEQGGADRVELCAGLLEGGTTPSAGIIELVKEKIALGLQVMIRPRGGDFLYSADEFNVMKKDIEVAKKLGADGLVFGVLNADGTVDKTRTAELITLSRPLPVTFHRAFDLTVNPFAALEVLIELGVERVLTSGQKQTAFEGADLIAALIKKAENKIIIMPGSGINDQNIGQLAKITQATEFHASARSAFKSKTTYFKDGISMASGVRQDEYSNFFADPAKILKLKKSIY